MKNDSREIMYHKKSTVFPPLRCSLPVINFLFHQTFFIFDAWEIIKYHRFFWSPPETGLYQSRKYPENDFHYHIPFDP